MWSICKKELDQFFSNLTGYITIILFLLINGIFLFMLQDSNIFDYGYATLDKFFELAPWILLFLIPALTMRSLSDEFRTGTFEILQTKPLTSWQIVLGKYVSVLIIIGFAIIPTFIYVLTIKSLSTVGLSNKISFWKIIFLLYVLIVGWLMVSGRYAWALLCIFLLMIRLFIYTFFSNSLIVPGIDIGGIAGSYAGLFLLGAVFAGISICCSGFTNNAVVAFLVSAFACLVIYFGFNAISKLPLFQGSADYYMEMLGIDFHYKSISRGVLDSRDVIYFLSIIFLFLLITVKKLQKR